MLKLSFVLCFSLWVLFQVYHVCDCLITNDSTVPIQWWQFPNCILNFIYFISSLLTESKFNSIRLISKLFSLVPDGYSIWLVYYQPGFDIQHIIRSSNIPRISFDFRARSNPCTESNPTAWCGPNPQAKQ